MVKLDSVTCILFTHETILHKFHWILLGIQELPTLLNNHLAWIYFGTWYFSKRYLGTEISSRGLFGMRTIWHENIWAWIYFSTMDTEMLWLWDISAQGYFGTWMFRHIYILENDKKYPCQNVLVPKCPSDEKWPWWNVHAKKSPGNIDLYRMSQQKGSWLLNLALLY